MSLNWINGFVPCSKHEAFYNWDGQDEINGGYIIVSSGGDVLAYHIYNRSFFESYLLNHTRFERASTSRHGFASLYKEDGKVFLKLNLQVRFC